MLLSTAVARILKAEGVETFTCFPNNALIEAAAVEGLRPVCARTERVAVNIADGLSRVSSGRRVGVTVVQYGPGTENAFGAVAQAYSDSTPLLFLPGGVERARQGVEPNFQATAAFRPVAKRVEVLNVPARVDLALRRAFTLLRSGKPGPVVVEIPTDVMKAEVPEEVVAAYRPVPRRVPYPDPADVREAVRLLLGASAPVIMAGQGVLYAEAWDELRTLAELAQAPVLTTLNGKSAFPEDHPLALGAGGGLSHPQTVAHFLQKADLVLGVGTSFTRSTFIVPIPPGKTLVQITLNEQDVNKDYAIDHAVIGDARATLGQMIAEVRARLGPEGRRGQGAVVREVRAVKEAYLRAWMGRLTSDEVPLSPYRVLWDLMHTLDRRRTIVTHDAGNPRDQMVPFWEALIPHGYVGWGKSTQLGTGLGLAMGARLAASHHVVVNVMGDVAFGMVGMDVETAVRERLPILTVILNNGLMGGYDRYLPVASERYRVRYVSGEYARVGEALGAYAERVDKPHELVGAIRRALAEVDAGRPAVLEVLTREEATYPRYL